MKKNTLSNKDIALQSVFTLFLTKGFQATSMDDIVAHSKVSKTNIYYHFKSKEELLLTIVQQLISHYEQRIHNILSQSETSVLEKLERLLIILTENTEQNEYIGGCPFLTLYTQTPIEAFEVRDKIKSFFEQQLHAVKVVLAEGIAKQEIKAELNVQQTAALIISSIEGALFLAQASNNPDIIKAVYPALASLLK
ncbi:TetR/AcrR family transcriptional regulator [Paenibacillus apiarius]|uniref:TetR/AcrR family transcriptional regulator n=1 Tax=Paenibacillus apiarius TaxID=46240 RepID=A0ABT4DVH5_9BACL|nr:TetR/AcrR family transcriptional regulator [Paenibacillus apiarius]MCY9516375.1 TetR/AcrR family transcriptional regulator [Paenibacillus apiarius]MCY9519976.1 TetR/AcrR family transcriptional regulator [Paenibacillus apiarius]MCY9554401.1 TetR/AcrR family transcriptional regulator [Paenibacillus apiarius]MCY9558192.1 TetR/AcrR family transcriptional regulator [Paenibacillus apiarius]MCY9684987.1 TetR/AcrR family transcriptional regulator [Paenibacillus apiarius]